MSFFMRSFCHDIHDGDEVGRETVVPDPPGLFRCPQQHVAMQLFAKTPTTRAKSPPLSEALETTEPKKHTWTQKPNPRVRNPATHGLIPLKAR